MLVGVLYPFLFDSNAGVVWLLHCDICVEGELRSSLCPLVSLSVKTGRHCKSPSHASHVQV